jgi:hypothetical protein
MNVDTGELQALREHEAALEGERTMLIRALGDVVSRIPNEQWLEMLTPPPARPQLRLIKGGRS